VIKKLGENIYSAAGSTPPRSKPLLALGISLTLAGCATIPNAYDSTTKTIKGWVTPDEPKPVEVSLKLSRKKKKRLMRLSQPRPRPTNKIRLAAHKKTTSRVVFYLALIKRIYNDFNLNIFSRFSLS